MAGSRSQFSFTLYDSESVQDSLEIIFGQFLNHVLSALLFEFSKAIKHNHLQIANTFFPQIWCLLRFVHSVDLWSTSEGVGVRSVDLCSTVKQARSLL